MPSVFSSLIRGVYCDIGKNEIKRNLLFGAAEKPILQVVWVYPNNLKNWFFGCAKTPGIKDRKRACIVLILTRLRSLIRGSFCAAQKPLFSFYLQKSFFCN